MCAFFTKPSREGGGPRNPPRKPFSERKQNSNPLFSFANEIFYKFGRVEDVDVLRKYMFLLENVEKWGMAPRVAPSPAPLPKPLPTPSPTPLPKPSPSPPPPPPQPSRISPHKPDSLFWCIFIAIHGYDEFLMIHNGYTNRKLEEKQKIMQYVQSHSPQMKEMNVKITLKLIQQIMSELMVDKNTSYLSLYAFVAYYDITIYIMNPTNRTYLKFAKAETTESTRTICLFIDASEHFPRYTLDPQFDVATIDNQYMALENYERPLKCISSYKVTDLTQIVDRLKELHSRFPQESTHSKRNDFFGAVADTKMKKPELYVKLTEYCVWKQ